VEFLFIHLANADIERSLLSDERTEPSFELAPISICL
jgi:hypothetical protein